MPRISCAATPMCGLPMHSEKVFRLPPCNPLLNYAIICGVKGKQGVSPDYKDKTKEKKEMKDKIEMIISKALAENGIKADQTGDTFWIDTEDGTISFTVERSVGE